MTKDDRQAGCRIGIERLEVFVLTAVLVTIAGCSHDVPELVVEQERVRVERLGVVEPPPVHGADGEPIDGIEWVVPDAGSGGSVARVREGRVVAIEPGETEVVGHWHGQEVRWRLEVAPTVTLRFVDPPAKIGVGQALQLTVVAELSGATPVDRDSVQAEPIGGLAFESSSEDVLKVNATGELVGVAPGTGYITARTHGSRSVVEIHVVER